MISDIRSFKKCPRLREYLSNKDRLKNDEVQQPLGNPLSPLGTCDLPAIEINLPGLPELTETLYQFHLEQPAGEKNLSE